MVVDLRLGGVPKPEIAAEFESVRALAREPPPVDDQGDRDMQACLFQISIQCKTADE